MLAVTLERRQHEEPQGFFSLRVRMLGEKGKCGAPYLLRLIDQFVLDESDDGVFVH